MDEQQANNLRTLIRHMETDCHRTLDMGAFFLSCGTPACALGEATRLAHFQDLGLRNHRDCMCANENELFGEGNGERLFGVPRSNAWQRSDVSPLEWAAEARKALAEAGYSMDARDDGFAAFRAKLLEPVVVEA